MAHTVTSEYMYLSMYYTKLRAFSTLGIQVQLCKVVGGNSDVGTGKGNQRHRINNRTSPCFFRNNFLQLLSRAAQWTNPVVPASYPKISPICLQVFRTHATYSLGTNHSKTHD